MVVSGQNGQDVDLTVHTQYLTEPEEDVEPLFSDDDDYVSLWDDDEDLAFDPEDDLEMGVSNEDLGLCPHGCRDDEGCDVPGCLGGPEGMEDEDDLDFDDEVYDT